MKMIDLLTTLPTDRKRTHTGFVPSCPPAFFRISVDFALPPQQEYVQARIHAHRKCFEDLTLLYSVSLYPHDLYHNNQPYYTWKVGINLLYILLVRKRASITKFINQAMRPTRIKGN